MKWNNAKKIEAKQQTSAKKNEKNKKTKLLNLKKFANQAVFSQRKLSDDKLKLKKRFKFLITVLIEILNRFFKKDIRHFCKFRNQKMKIILSFLRKFSFRDD